MAGGPDEVGQQRMAMNGAFVWHPLYAMGGVFSRRVGSDPYYADYERVFKRLRTEVERLQVHC